MELYKFLLVFIAVFFADICWTLYFIKVDEKKPVSAAFWGTSIYALSAFSVLNYSHDGLYLIPALLGAFSGTYLSVKYNKKNKNKNNNE